MSAVQVYFGDKMAAVAHLIGTDQLPTPSQVQIPSTSFLTRIAIIIVISGFRYFFPDVIREVEYHNFCELLLRTFLNENVKKEKKKKTDWLMV